MKWFEPELAPQGPMWRKLLVPIAGSLIAAIALRYSDQDSWKILVAIVALAVAIQFGVPAPQGSRFGLSVAVGVATSIHFSTEGVVDVPSVLAVYGAGLAMGSLILWFRLKGEAFIPAVFRRFAGMTTYVFVYALAARLPGIESIDDPGWRIVIPLALGSISWLVVEVVLWVLTESPKDLRRRHLAKAILGDLNVFVSLVATGALFGLAYQGLGWWALGVAGLPYLFAHSAFARFHTIKRTYRQTIRALARIPEVAGLGVDGHADRTASLALAVGRDLGLSRSEIDDLEYAALMHDIGRITLTEPAILRSGYTDGDIAMWGAEIIAQAPYLDRIADHIRRLHEPYRKPGEQSDPSISDISKIVRVTSAFDHLMVERKMSALQAMEVLHEGAAYEFDPMVVAAMRRVLDRRMAFHPVAMGPAG